MAKENTSKKPKGGGALFEVADPLEIATGDNALEVGDLDEDPEGEPSVMDGLPYSGDIEADDALEAEKINETLTSALATSKSGIADNMRMGYYFHLVFMNETQADEFLAKAGAKVEMLDHVCIDGIALARQMGIELTPASMRFHGEKVERRLVDEVGVINPKLKKGEKSK